MEPTKNTPPADTGELIVQNGRLSGTHRPLTLPLTLIGRAAGCDVRLNVDGIEALHCALVQDAAGGLNLRHLGSSETLVNGKEFDGGALKEGDTLTIGPFHFEVRLPPEGADTAKGKFLREQLEEVEREREALRVQAAAVVAQQAALTETEVKLDQRRVALERQEQQLASHLEEKRQNLLALQNRVREDRDVFQGERKAQEEKIARQRRDLEKKRKEAEALQQKGEQERRRLVELRRRLKKRWHQQLDAEKAALSRREAELTGRQHSLEKEREQFEQEKVAQGQAWLQQNGQVELARRELQFVTNQLRQQQQQWHERQAREQGELRRAAAEMRDRAEVLADAEQDLADQQRHGERLRQALHQETEGLENRIRNQRRKIEEQAQLLRCLEGTVKERGQPDEKSPLPLVPVPPGVVPNGSLEAGKAQESFTELFEERLAGVEQLAGTVADQRLHLAEQFERLAWLQLGWAQDREEAVAGLEVLGARLLAREQTLDQREEGLRASECLIVQNLKEAQKAREHLEGWLARLSAREATWEGERERLLIQVQAREEAAQKQLAALLELRRRWSQRRRQEVKQVRGRLARFLETRKQYAKLWEDCFRRRAVLEREQRAVAEQALALEQYRLECLGQAPDSAAADKRLEQFRRRWASLSAAAQRNLARDRQALHREAARQHHRLRLEQRMAHDLTKREEALSGELAGWEQQQALNESAQNRLRQELQSLQAQRDQYERELQQLREELERVARLLIEGDEHALLPLAQAA
jgi:pSer/pThr/pTyr-binding forkhead associated (FHA) protein